MSEQVIIHDLIPLAEQAQEGSMNVLESVYSGIPWDVVLITYTLIFFDLFYGVIVSTVLKETVSHKMMKGLKNKIFVLFVPIVGILLKAFFVVCSIPAEWGGGVAGIFGVSALSHFPICLFLCGFVIFMEFVSFLETSAKIDSRAKKLLGFIHKKAEKVDDVRTLMVDDEDTVLSH